MAKFDSKTFNAEAFGKYMSAIPNTKLNKLRSSRAIVNDERLKSVFKDNTQTGTVHATIPYYGLLTGSAQNYDGSTDLVPGGTRTFDQGVFTYGRMMGWTEADFSYDVTGGEDFMANVRVQINQYWNGVDQDVLLSILKGIFSMSGNSGLAKKNADFVAKHTYNIAANEGDASNVGATTLNSAIQKACGDNKSKFGLACMHSVVSTNLENLKLLAYLKYTDENGVERDLELGTWNGRLVIVDDSMPATDVATTYAKTTDVALDSSKTYYTKSGTTYTAVASPDVANIGTYYEVTDEAHTEYTTYLLGDGAIGFEPVGAKVPYEMDRDAKTNGGQDTLISRQRNAISVAGISYTKSSQASNSPTNTELETASNWALVNDGTNTIDDKAIPIARIVSRG